MTILNAAMPSKAYEAIIFDCDGTLTDSMPIHYMAWDSTLRPLGFDFPEDRFYALAGMPSDKIVALLAAEQNLSVLADVVADAKEQAFLRLIELLEPIDIILEVAKWHRQKVPMVVASGGTRPVISQQLKQIGCFDWFDAIVTSEDTVRHKPAPDVFLEAARRVSVEPARCLVYEDADLGIRAAQAAGMDVIDVRVFHAPKRVTSN